MTDNRKNRSETFSRQMLDLGPCQWFKILRHGQNFQKLLSIFFSRWGYVWDFYSLWPQWQMLCFSSLVNMKKEVEGWEGSHVLAGVKRAAVASADISEITLTSFLLGVYPWVMMI